MPQRSRVPAGHRRPNPSRCIIGPTRLNSGSGSTHNRMKAGAQVMAYEFDPTFEQSLKAAYDSFAVGQPQRRSAWIECRTRNVVPYESLEDDRERNVHLHRRRILSIYHELFMREFKNVEGFIKNEQNTEETSRALWFFISTLEGSEAYHAGALDSAVYSFLSSTDRLSPSEIVHLIRLEGLKIFS